MAVPSKGMAVSWRVPVVGPSLMVDPGDRGPSHPHGAPGRALSGQDGGALRSSPVPARTRIPNIGSQRGFSAGTMDGYAGYCRHDVPSCRQNRVASAPRRALFMDIRYGLTVSGSCPARTGRAGDRTSEPDRRLDCEPTHRADLFGLGMWLWDTPDTHSVRTGGRCAGRMTGSPASPAPASTRIQND
jgi:hypothetical protein